MTRKIENEKFAKLVWLCERCAYHERFRDKGPDWYPSLDRSFHEQLGVCLEDFLSGWRWKVHPLPSVLSDKERQTLEALNFTTDPKSKGRPKAWYVAAGVLKSAALRVHTETEALKYRRQGIHLAALNEEETLFDVWYGNTLSAKPMPFYQAYLFADFMYRSASESMQRETRPIHMPDMGTFYVYNAYRPPYERDGYAHTTIVDLLNARYMDDPSLVMNAQNMVTYFPPGK